MARTWHVACSWAVMLWLGITAAFAAPLSFEAAVTGAMDGPAGRAVIAEALQSVGSVREELGWEDNPSLGFETGPTESVWTLEVDLDLGSLAALGAVAPSRQAIEARAQWARTSVGVAAGAAWLDARRAQDEATIADGLERVASLVVHAAEVRARAGELGAVDRTLLGGDGARALREAWDMRQREQTLQANLSVLIGGDPTTPLDLGDWPALVPPPALSTTDLPSVLSATLEARAALARRHAASWGRLPDVTLTGGWSREDGGEEGPVVGAALEIPLFATGLQRARGESDLARVQVELSTLEGTRALAEARAELEIATRVAAVWEGVDVRLALEALYAEVEAGELDPATQLVRRREVTALALEAIEARWRLQRASLALWELAGRLPPGTSP